MAKGRKSNPKALQKLRGNPRKKGRNPPAEPTFETSIPPMPEFLKGKAVDEWMRVTQELADKQIITNVDMGIVAVYCHALGRFHDVNDALRGQGMTVESTRGISQINPLMREEGRLRQEIAKYSSELGITPTARNKVRMVGQGQAKPTKERSIAENLFKVPVKK